MPPPNPTQLTEFANNNSSDPQNQGQQSAVITNNKNKKLDTAIEDIPYAVLGESWANAGMSSQEIIDAILSKGISKYIYKAGLIALLNIGDYPATRFLLKALRSNVKNCLAGKREYIIDESYDADLKPFFLGLWQGKLNSNLPAYFHAQLLYAIKDGKPHNLRTEKDLLNLLQFSAAKETSFLSSLNNKATRQDILLLTSAILYQIVVFGDLSGIKELLQMPEDENTTAANNAFQLSQHNTFHFAFELHNFLSDFNHEPLHQQAIEMVHSYFLENLSASDPEDLQAFIKSLPAIFSEMPVQVTNEATEYTSNSQQADVERQNNETQDQENSDAGLTRYIRGFYNILCKGIYSLASIVMVDVPDRLENLVDKNALSSREKLAVAVIDCVATTSQTPVTLAAINIIPAILANLSNTEQSQIIRQHIIDIVTLYMSSSNSEIIRAAYQITPDILSSLSQYAGTASQQEKLINPLLKRIYNKDKDKKTAVLKAVAINIGKISNGDPNNFNLKVSCIDRIQQQTHKLGSWDFVLKDLSTEAVFSILSQESNKNYNNSLKEKLIIHFISYIQDEIEIMLSTQSAFLELENIGSRSISETSETNDIFVYNFDHLGLHQCIKALPNILANMSDSASHIEQINNLLQEYLKCFESWDRRIKRDTLDHLPAILTSLPINKINIHLLSDCLHSYALNRSNKQTTKLKMLTAALSLLKNEAAQGFDVTFKQHLITEITYFGDISKPSIDDETNFATALKSFPAIITNLTTSEDDLKIKKRLFETFIKAHTSSLAAIKQAAIRTIPGMLALLTNDEAGIAVKSKIISTLSNHIQDNTCHYQTTDVIADILLCTYTSSATKINMALTIEDILKALKLDQVDQSGIPLENLELIPSILANLPSTNRTHQHRETFLNILIKAIKLDDVKAQCTAITLLPSVISALAKDSKLDLKLNKLIKKIALLLYHENKSVRKAASAAARDILLQLPSNIADDTLFTLQRSAEESLLDWDDEVLLNAVVATATIFEKKNHDNEIAPRKKILCSIFIKLLQNSTLWIVQRGIEATPIVFSCLSSEDTEAQALLLHQLTRHTVRQNEFNNDRLRSSAFKAITNILNTLPKDQLSRLDATTVNYLLRAILAPLNFKYVGQVQTTPIEHAHLAISTLQAFLKNLETSTILDDETKKKILDTLGTSINIQNSEGPYGAYLVEAIRLAAINTIPIYLSSYPIENLSTSILDCIIGYLLACPARKPCSYYNNLSAIQSTVIKLIPQLLQLISGRITELENQITCTLQTIRTSENYLAHNSNISQLEAQITNLNSLKQFFLDKHLYYLNLHRLRLDLNGFYVQGAMLHKIALQTTPEILSILSEDDAAISSTITNRVIACLNTVEMINVHTTNQAHLCLINKPTAIALVPKLIATIAKEQANTDDTNKLINALTACAYEVTPTEYVNNTQQVNQNAANALLALYFSHKDKEDFFLPRPPTTDNSTEYPQVITAFDGYIEHTEKCKEAVCTLSQWWKHNLKVEVNRRVLKKRRQLAETEKLPTSTNTSSTLR